MNKSKLMLIGFFPSCFLGWMPIQWIIYLVLVVMFLFGVYAAWSFKVENGKSFTHNGTLAGVYLGLGAWIGALVCITIIIALTFIPNLQDVIVSGYGDEIESNESNLALIRIYGPFSFCFYGWLYLMASVAGGMLFGWIKQLDHNELI
jgi:hypothetical protein